MRDAGRGLTTLTSAIRAGGVGRRLVGTARAGARRGTRYRASFGGGAGQAPIQLQLEGKADIELLVEARALAARARSKPWEDWDEKEQDEMRPGGRPEDGAV